MTGVLVGVDLGTTETKALVITPDGAQVGFAGRPTSWTTRVETTADALLGDLLGAVADALDAARDRLGARVRALGLGIAGFAESGVLLGPSGAPVSPVIAWFDQRGRAELAALDPELRAEFPRRTGLPVLPQWTIGKLLWLRGTGVRMKPGSRWLNVPEYLAHALGADQVTEPSLASRTGLLDQAGGRPWPAALRLLDAPSDLLPPLLPAGHSAGRVGAEGVPEGLRGAVVTVVGHDHPVAAFGVGAVGPHDLLNSCGTAEVVLRAVPGELTDDQREALVSRGIEAGRHVIAGRSVLIGGLRGGLVMRRVLALLGADDPAGRARLDDAWRPVTPSGVTLTGARPGDEAVHVRLDGYAPGGAGGTGRAPGSTPGGDTGPDALWAAALAHTGEVTGELLDGMASVVGAPRAAVAVGGWTRMRSVRETKRRLLPGVRFTELAEPGAFGAALCAGWAAAGSPGELLDFAEPLRTNALTLTPEQRGNALAERAPSSARAGEQGGNR
ncbi:FGGY family carbohydrate kinase [Pseudonocardia eucalypti]|uniref:FGGY family carbohydrate kinase n=1 Tax=Pseudonocardia eucalypti TaxID=648755 RepID=A0ABP9R1A3_9PSEU|nr:sugar (pentulose or hexulose) kinase [Pseudonocardia eucalypti]